MTQDGAILDSIADYNKDDCISTAHMRDSLEGLRPPGVTLEIVDDTAAEKREQSAERAALEARKQTLLPRYAAALTATRA